MGNMFSERLLSYNENDTNANADVGCRLLSEWSELLCVEKTMASTSGRSFKGKTKFPVYALEENGSL